MVIGSSELRSRRTASALSLKALEAFVTVVDCESITRAAKRLGVTQPAVSIAIQELEAIVGKPLIDRSTRPLSPTHAGLELHKRAVQLLSDADKMLVSVTSPSAHSMVSLRLGVAGPMMGSSWVFELQSLAEELHVLGGLSIDLQGALLARKVDAAVLSDMPMYDHAGIERRQLLEESFLLVLPQSRQNQWRHATLHEMAERLPLIRYSRRTTIGRVVDVYLRRCALEVPRRLEFETSNSVMEMVQAGLGWTITTPLCIAESRVPLPTIAMKTLRTPPPPRTLYLLHYHGEFPLADRVCEVLRTSLKEMVTQSFGGEHEAILKLVSFDEGNTGTNAASALL